MWITHTCCVHFGIYQAWSPTVRGKHKAQEERKQPLPRVYLTLSLLERAHAETEARNIWKQAFPSEATFFFSRFQKIQSIGKANTKAETQWWKAWQRQAAHSLQGSQVAEQNEKSQKKGAQEPSGSLELYLMMYFLQAGPTA